MRNLSCHYVEKFEETNFYLNLKHKFKKPPLLDRHILMYCACSFLLSGGLVCLANLGGLCLHSEGSWRPGVPAPSSEMRPRVENRRKDLKRNQHWKGVVKLPIELWWCHDLLMKYEMNDSQRENKTQKLYLHIFRK